MKDLVKRVGQIVCEISQIIPICERKYGNDCINSNFIAIHMAFILLLYPLIVNKIIKFPPFPGKA